MSKIRFSLMDSYDGSNRKYMLIFIIHEQDMTWRADSCYASPNGIIIDTSNYGYISIYSHIFLKSIKKKTSEQRGFVGENTSIVFDTHNQMIEHKKRIIQAIKDWSHG